ncbi:MAG TPA: OsmC family peroxiredoxin [Actinomycetota bacterium]|nr:OsmC family peroxiredoxin [Actinomycetota bacterium]
MAKRTAKTTWKGTLIDGRGELTLESSGLLSGTQVTWASRTEEPRGTSPEELLAGAQAACYAMALSNTLAQQGTPPDSLEVSATCAFERSGEGFAVTTMDITVRGAVPGVDEAVFREAAEKAKEGCPISNAIRGNVEIGLTAKLA